MRGFGARQSPVTANGGDALALRHFGLDGVGFGEGIGQVRAGILFD